MPAATTHYEFSKDVYLNLSNEIVDKITNLHMYYLGSQGPDLFFFSEAGIGKSSLNTYGSLLHKEKIHEVITYLYEHSLQDSDLLSYTYGYICHYALDSLAHPLIYYMAAHGLQNNESENIKHFRIEAYIDSKILESKERTISSYDVYKAVAISKCDNVKLASLYQKLFKDLFNIDISFNKIQQTIKDCPKYLRLLKPQPTKFKVIGKIESILKMDHYASSLMLNNELNEDVLNLQKRQWFNIFEPEIKANDSFFELYDNAIVKAEKIINNPLDQSNQTVSFDGKNL